ncbi:MAG: NAD(P)/FAD-dependent oxidoreductase [Oscillospiraceae bacterium]|jgi:prolycopene isomerase|nr:NAD(P)/FAD-dependent oxidoreductase [Oscillospiraceae bacterium]
MAENQYDAIVIGAGPGGTTVASLLANDGKRVLLVDKNSSAGGKMITIHRDGHYYEMFPLNLIPYGPSLFEKLAETIGKADKVRNVAAAFPDDKVIILYHDREGKIHTLDSGDMATFKSLGMSLPDIVKSIAAVVKMLAISASPKKLASLNHISALDYMNSLNIPEITRVFITAAFGEGAFEMSSDKVPASHMIRAFKLGIDRKNHPTPRYYEGGVGGFFTTMAETVPEHGGKILWNTRVQSVNIEDGRAVGITTESGETYTAPLVISNAGIRQTVVKLVGEEHFPKAYAGRIKGLQSNLADVGWRYFTTEKVLPSSTFVYFPYNCLEPWSAFEEMKDGKKKPTSNYIYIGSKSVYPTVSPEGKQVIYAVMSSHPDPEQDLTQYLDYIESKMHLLFPKLFEDGVLERKEVMGLHEVYALGVDKIFDGQGGESYGIANSIGQSDEDRPTCDLPIRGLYCVGNDTEGFGVGTHRATESGFLTYQKITGKQIPV